MFLANDEKPSSVANGAKKLVATNNNLLIAATAASNKPFGGDLVGKNNLNLHDDIDGDIDAGSSDGESSVDLKQKKKELIIARQLERRKQQEMIRIKREEERARKAEEQRLREEEAANKKLLEKTRKEVIFQAYIDRKRQMQEESQSGMFGPNPSLLNAKRFYSTQRLKQSPSINNKLSNAAGNTANNNSGLLKEYDHQKQSIIDQFDQASIYSERSQPGGPMAKSKCCIHPSLVCMSSPACFVLFSDL